MKALKSILYQVSIDLVLKSMWTCSYPKLRTWNKVKIKTEVMALQACGSFSKPKKNVSKHKSCANVGQLKCPRLLLFIINAAS